jgi:hypothetical protein
MPITLSGDGAISGLTATGISAVQKLPAGTVLQVVQGTTSTPVNNSTATFVDTGLTATITPQFSTSKVLVLVFHPETARSGGDTGSDIGFNISRNGSSIFRFNQGLAYTGTNISIQISTSSAYLDSPATTSALTYKTQFRNSDGSAVIQVQTNSAQSTSTIILMEIAG